MTSSSGPRRDGVTVASLGNRRVLGGVDAFAAMTGGSCRRQQGKRKAVLPIRYTYQNDRHLLADHTGVQSENGSNLAAPTSSHLFRSSPRRNRVSALGREKFL